MTQTSCPICGLELGNGQRVGDASMKDGPHRHLFEVWCPQCHIKLRRVRTGRNDTGWPTPPVEVSEIFEYLDDSQLGDITERLTRYPHVFTRWRDEFLDIKREDDRIGRYATGTEGNAALAIIRENVVIAIFETFSNL